RFHPELCMAGSVLVASFTACGLPCRPRAAQGPRVLLHRVSTPRCANPPVFTEGAGETSPRHLPHVSIPLGLTDIETDEALDGHARLVDDLLDRLLVLLDERLSQKRHFLEVTVETALHDLGDRLLGLALLACGLLGDTALVGHHVLGDVVL